MFLKNSKKSSSKPKFIIAETKKARELNLWRVI